MYVFECAHHEAMIVKLQTLHISEHEVFQKLDNALPVLRPFGKTSGPGLHAIVM
jgi:hypothetical protein